MLKGKDNYGFFQITGIIVTIEYIIWRATKNPELK
jgi:hypothetical protein